MGTVTNICALLLFIGACTAKPQYPGQGDDIVVKEAPSQCLSHQDCVSYYQCENGTIKTDGGGLLDLRTKPKQAPQEFDGKCNLAETPLVPAICCNIPGVPISPIYVPCHHGPICVDKSQCVIGGAIQDLLGDMVPYAPGAPLDSWASCDNNKLPGVCCAAPLPPPVQPIEPCTGNKVCVGPKQCDAKGNVVTDGAGQLDLRIVNNQRCHVQETTAAGGYGEQTTSEVGVCCNLPIEPPRPSGPLVRVIECNQKSKCMYEYQCEAGGEIIDNTGNLVRNIEGGSYARCEIDGTPGVCCLNPKWEPPIATQCGVRKPVIDQRIKSDIAFNEAEFGEFPWQAIIFQSNYTFKCGASLIGNKWLVTAAHCVNDVAPSALKIRLGEWQVNTFDEFLPYLDMDIATVTIHPNFVLKNVHNDVAVLELSQAIDYQYHYNTICLPEPGQTFWGEQCIATGWGQDAFEGQYQEILKKVRLPTVETQQCQDLLRKTRLGKYFQLHESFMCAGGEENKDACKGDGGGPLACRDPTTGRYVLTGITAFGIGCGDKDVPGVYADVQFLLPFINAVTSGSYNPTTFGKIVKDPVEVETVPGYGN